VTDGRVRAFFAIDLGAAARGAARAALAQLRDAPGGDAVRWVRPEGLHVTLHFLGDIAFSQAAPLARSVGETVQGIEPFRLELGGARRFPSARRPRGLALDVQPAGSLVELAAAVGRGLLREGIAPESRPFRPHVTLGRIRRGAGPDPRGIAVAASTAVDEVVLFRSELSRSGARYTPLERVGFSHPRFNRKES